MNKIIAGVAVVLGLGIAAFWYTSSSGTQATNASVLSPISSAEAQEIDTSGVMEITMGDPNASIPTPQPVFMRPMFGAFGSAPGPVSIAFVSQRCASDDVAGSYGLSKAVEPVRRCRSLGKGDMKLNDATPEITVDPETYEVTADGERLECEPAKELPLAQKYFLF